MLPEYDFRGGVRGKYAARFAKGINIVVLAPDVAKCFPDSDSVNDALRVIIRVGTRRRRSA
jgi:hypothetical protein